MNPQISPEINPRVIRWWDRHRAAYYKWRRKPQAVIARRLAAHVETCPRGCGRDVEGAIEVEFTCWTGSALHAALFEREKP